jgi:hypothetical protein
MYLLKTYPRKNDGRSNIRRNSCHPEVVKEGISVVVEAEECFMLNVIVIARG